jgi:hypothetical protein
MVPRQPGAGQQDLMHTVQGGGHSGKHFCCVRRLALVLVVAAGLDALGLDMFAVKHQDMGFLVV